MATLTPSKPQTKIQQRIQFRPAARSEMSIAARMIRSSADMYAEFVSEDDLSEHYVDESWEEENFLKRDFYLGYNEEGKAVGTISLQYFEGYTYVGYLYLDTRFTGRGYGKEFLNFACKQAKKHGRKGLCLIAHPEADWAVKAYERYGFFCKETEQDKVLAWNNGVMQDYFEEGFHLYLYHLNNEAQAA